MKRTFTTYGGDRPLYTQPPIQVVGGFTLDPTQTNFAAGAVIPFGTLAHVDESTRLAKLIKSARVVAIDGSNAKLVTVESDEFSKPLFVVGDLLASDLTAAASACPTINAMEVTDAGLKLTLSKSITGLAVGDPLFEVVADTAQGATGVLLVAEPNAITIGEGAPCAEVKAKLGDTGIDVTRDSGSGEIYARRVPPVPASYMEGARLKGTNVLYTNSL